MQIDRLATTLTERVAGDVCLDHQSLAGASRDFGGVVEARPRIVVWPNDTDDLVAIVRTAREMGTPLAVRGAGHSQGGQALNRGGIVIQTQRLNRIEAISEKDRWVTAGAGMLWSDLLDEVIERNVLPPVLTDQLKVTLGGTLAVGGLGPASFRQGAQIDHCLGLEIVLGTGEAVWTSAKQRPRLFRHVLGGLGQFGVVTKVRLRLRSAEPFVRSHYHKYPNVESFLSDAERLMTRPSVHFLSGCAVPKNHPVAGSSHDFVLTVSGQLDQIQSGRQRKLVGGMGPQAHGDEYMTTRQYVARLDATFDGYRRPTETDVTHPWVEHFLPIAAVPKYVEWVTEVFPTVAILLWPMRTANFHQPMLRLPAVDGIALVGVLSSPRHSNLREVLPYLRRLDELGVALGGKRYLSGWLDFDSNRWRQYYGTERWKEIASLKSECDPDRLFRLWEGT
jgi:cytokinin dehydrogenase